MSDETLKRKLGSAEPESTKKLKQDENVDKKEEALEKEAVSEPNDTQKLKQDDEGNNEETHKSDTTLVIPDDSQEEEAEPEAKEDTAAAETKKDTNDSSASPKPVFGATSTFGKASIFERMKTNTNVFDNGAEKGNATASSFGSSFGSLFGLTGLFGLFGANSKFANALQKATEKKSFLDEPEKESESTSPSETPKATQQYKQVELVAQDVKTGEENEHSLYSSNAKLFELDLTKISDGWKERGIGPLHLNQSLDDPSQVRIVMRSQGLLRVILNYRISPSTVLLKGLEASLSPGKFVRFNAVSPEGKPVQYLLKFANETLRDTLVEKVADVKQSGSKEHDKSTQETDEDSGNDH